MKKILKSSWSIEPGDGTGCSIADAIVRNNNGICSTFNCGKAILPDAKTYCDVGKLCPDCEVLRERYLLQLREMPNGCEDFA